MRNFFVSILFFSLFTLLCAISLYGVIVAPIEKSYPVGSLRLGAFENGLSLFRINDRYFYTISPYNDYIINHQAVRSSIYTQEELKEKSIKTNLQKSHWENILGIIFQYFGLQYPSIAFSGKVTVGYQSTISGNSVRITRTIIDPLPLNASSSAMTVAYFSGDYIFDSYGNLYTYQTPEDLELFSKIYQVRLQPTINELRRPIDDSIVYIVNPETSAFIKIAATANQKIWINRDANLLEVEENAVLGSKDYVSHLDITVLEGMEKSVESL
ncbi:hypothetical protein HYW55_03795 [Candidatus Gottesmanbacteria bacterium]|nr:hypothetical protein [Candidatus Gottesmanbacteria bacterium]